MKKISLPLTISLLNGAVYAGVRILSPQLLNETASKYLLALILGAFAIAAIRTFSYVLFDIIFVRRKGRVAPALLRAPVSIVLYAVSFVLIYNRVLNSGLGGI